MIIIDKSYTPAMLRKLLIDNVDSGKLILVGNDDSARQIGKTTSLIQVSTLLNIPLISSGDLPYVISDQYGITCLSWRSSIMTLRACNLFKTGYPCDESVPMSFHEQMKRESIGHLRTGFYSSSMFI